MQSSCRTAAAFLLVSTVFCRSLAAKPVTALQPPVFLAGGDLSVLAREEQLGAVYKDNGKPREALQIFKSHGWNIVRLRLWVHPTGQGDHINDLPYTVALAKRIKRAGFQFLLDLHYSDYWADPGQQTKPAAWKDLTFDQLTQQVRTYSRGGHHNTAPTRRDAGHRCGRQ